ncbi:MobC family plasmid mobilization relaxosome protein [Sphingobium sp. AS12]|uniref:plasmid mobilization relaxosome protein MobC n=1 Tax=Sphingobium sp. AS12 TaxID=2849495 RepID=UPI001C318BB3|nr:plasmid mobilization relaxosome protein MobC [Sphingobium sp. AS12]MBV2147708.1 MobC family plasmid mobilization relaxosome protein [Sphingobium sp. AS12]
MARKPYDPPFSLRLSFEERARLEQQADGTPLGAYIRERLLAEPPRRSRITPADRQALIQLLGGLGQSRIANNLNQLAKQANLGTLPVTPDTETALAEAAADIAAMRQMLVKALGLDAAP